MNQIHIYDDGVMYGYRLRLFEAIANENERTLLVLHATDFELSTNLPNLKLMKNREYKFGRFRFRSIGDYCNFFNKKCVIAINWNYPLDLLIGLLSRSKFWGGGFTVRACKTVYLYFFLKIFSILGGGIMLYSNKRLSLTGRNIYFFRNLSQFCFVKKRYSDNKIIHELPSKYVLFVGRIDSRKGLEELFSISGTEINYVIVGSGPELQKLIQLSKKNGLRVLFISATTDLDLLSEIFKRSSLIVSPGQTGLLAEDATFFRKRMYTINSDYSGPEPAVSADDGYIKVFDNIMDLYNAMRKYYENDRHETINSIPHQEWMKNQLLDVIKSWSTFLQLNGAKNNIINS